MNDLRPIEYASPAGTPQSRRTRIALGVAGWLLVAVGAFGLFINASVAAIGLSVGLAMTPSGRMGSLATTALAATITAGGVWMLRRRRRT
jgi:hypothetical protein